VAFLVSNPRAKIAEFSDLPWKFEQNGFGMPSEPAQWRYRFSTVTRLTHWVNAPLLLAMIWSGFCIYWANDNYRIGWGEITVVKFFPQWFYGAFGLERKLAEGMAWHFTIMWPFFLNGLIYAASTTLLRTWSKIVPWSKQRKVALASPFEEVALRKGTHRAGEYGCLQRLSYVTAIGLGMGSILSGLAIYKPVQLNWLTFVFGGYEFARIVHFVICLFLCIFIVVHVVQVLRAGWPTLQGMITGWVPTNPRSEQ